MSANAYSNWNTGIKSGLVALPGHNISFYASGADRSPGEPAVIIIPGLASSITGWAAVIHLLNCFIRVFSYDRAGYGNSSVEVENPTSTFIANDLDLLLKKANVAPPYLIVTHSWGGILTREFLAIPGRKDDVIGMVFVEANQERTLEVLDWRKLAFSAVLSGVDQDKAIGLLEKEKLTPEDWAKYRETSASAKDVAAGNREFAEYESSFPILATKKQLHQNPPFLSEAPVAVIRGDNGANFQKLYDAGVAQGNGNLTERAQFLETVQKWDEKDTELQSEIMSLSSIHQYRQVSGAGHEVQLISPDAIVDGVIWVRSKLRLKQHPEAEASVEDRQ